MNKLQKILFVLLSVFAIDYSLAEIKPPAQQKILAPGYGALEFSAPEPGSYTLPALDSAADGKVLDTQGKALTLPALLRSCECFYASV